MLEFDLKSAELLNHIFEIILIAPQYLQIQRVFYTGKNKAN